MIISNILKEINKIIIKAFFRMKFLFPTRFSPITFFLDANRNLGVCFADNFLSVDVIICIKNFNLTHNVWNFINHTRHDKDTERTETLESCSFLIFKSQIQHHAIKAIINSCLNIFFIKLFIFFSLIFVTLRTTETILSLNGSQNFFQDFWNYWLYIGLDDSNNLAEKDVRSDFDFCFIPLDGFRGVDSEKLEFIMRYLVFAYRINELTKSLKSRSFYSSLSFFLLSNVLSLEHLFKEEYQVSSKRSDRLFGRLANLAESEQSCELGLFGVVQYNYLRKSLGERSHVVPHFLLQDAAKLFHRSQLLDHVQDVLVFKFLDDFQRSVDHLVVLVEGR